MKKQLFLSHRELCELFDIPETYVLSAVDDAMIWRPDAQMWLLTINYRPKEESEEP